MMSSVRATRKTREIVFAGRLIKEKRLDRWLNVVARTVKITRAKGVIIGDGPEVARIKAQIRRMKLEGKVELRGFYSGANKSALFKRIKEAGLFLHMSEREGLSTVALESIALGTPVLLPSYTPIPDDVKRMCIVADERVLPETAAKMLNGKKQDYIPNREGMKEFYTSNLLSIYREIFRKVGARRKRE
jgi:glycosyltransferase involved in cell wall biosynthesis